MNLCKKLPLTKICEDNGIRLCEFSENKDLLEHCGLDYTSYGGGFAIMVNGKPYIFFDESRPEWELRHTVAHEVAHILLGHLDYRQINGRLPEYAEDEANTFAAAIMVQDLLAAYGENA